MRIRDFAVIGIGAMVLFQFATSFASINMLTRMSPAIERILEENDASLAAAEEMLASLIATGNPDVRRRAFSNAHYRAKKNITEPEETAVLASIERQMNAAFAGDETATGVVTEAIHELTKINRASMRRADNEAKRIGNAGAWTMVLLGIVGFFAGVFLLRRIVRGLVSPMEEIRLVLEAQMEGNSERRLILRNATPDIKEVAELINRIIGLKSVTEECGMREAERRTLLHLLDLDASPAMLLTTGRRKLATNRAMEALLSGEDPFAVKSVLGLPLDPEAPPPGWKVEDIGGVALLLRKVT